MKILSEPIEAAVWFKQREKPIPIKFKYIGRDGTSNTIVIDKILFVEETKLAGIKALVYRCQSQVKGVLKVYELKYIINECRWELYKM